MSYRATTANLDWATGLALDRAQLDHLAEHSDVLFVQEAKNLRLGQSRLSSLLGDGWSTLQEVSSAARAGSAIAVKKGSGLPFRPLGLV